MGRRTAPTPFLYTKGNLKQCLIFLVRGDDKMVIMRKLAHMTKFLSHLVLLLSMVSIFVGCKHKEVVVVAPIPVTHVVYSPGENLTSLTKVHETENNCDYPFGGDGGRTLFFAVHDKNGTSNIFRKDNPTSMSMSQLTGGKSRNVAPSYSAVINKVAFDGRPEGNSVSDIYLVNATQGGALQQITNTPDAYEQYPCISRDGKRIVYEKVLRGRNPKDTEIWIKNIETNENIQLGLGRTPSFSPDGRSIVYVKYNSDDYTTCLWIVNTDGSNPTQLTNTNMGSVWRPCFSPDSKNIVFQCTKQQKGDADLYVIDRNGNALTQLTINKSFDGEPYWANDGNIYFTSDRGGRDKHYQIWRFRFGSVSSMPIDTGKKNIEKQRVNNSSYVGTIHIVKEGESITQIAKQYGVTVKDIVRWNNLMTMTISSGMKLKVSGQ